MRKVIISMLCFYATANFAQNIELVKDINPNGSSMPLGLKIAKYKESMVSTNTRLFFNATDDQNKGVFLTNGTSASTTKILENITNAYGYTTFNTLNFYVQSPVVLFICQNSAYGIEIWRTNGTINNTQLVKDIYTGTNSSNPSNIIVYNFKAYFAASSSNTLRSIYSTEATQLTTQIAVPFNTGINSMIFTIDTLNGKLIFAANTLINGAELWVSDGTEAGTQLVKDIFTGSANGFDTLYGRIKFSPVRFNNKIFFSAKNNTYNTEPWFSDGTSTGTLCLKEINPNGGSNPSNFIVCNNNLYFTAHDGSEFGIYKSNGTVNNADKVLSLGTHAPSTWYFYKDGLFYFDNTGMLKRFDVLNNTVENIKQFNSDPYSTYRMYEYNEWLYLRAYGLDNHELWRTDGTTANTIQLLPQGATKPGNPSQFIEFNGSLYFSANFDDSGMELWKLTDSTSMLPPTFQEVSRANIFPNPANDFINIQSLNSEEFHIYNCYGTKVLSVRNNGYSIAINHLPASLYFVRDENNQFIGKFIKK